MQIINTLAIIYLFLFSLYHVITGIISVFFTDFSLKFYKKLYGFHPKETKQLKLIHKPWGNLAICVGVVGFITLFNIGVFYIMIFAFVLLLLIRIWYRLGYQDQLYKDMKMTKSQNYRMIIIQLIGIILFLYLGISKII